MTGETILVIDSDTETTQAMVVTLEAEDYLVFTAPSGDVGITMAKKINPTLIFVNPAIAGASGLEVCKTIHGMELFKNVPIVILSAIEGKMDARYTALYGIVDSLKKPFSPEELISKTRGVLSMHPAAEPDVEADMDFGETGEAAAAEETLMPQMHKGFSEEMDFSDSTIVVSPKEDTPPSDKTVVKPVKEKTVGEEKIEHTEIPREEPEERTGGERERTYVLKRNIRRKGMGNRILVLIIAVVVIGLLGAGGFLAYKKGLIPGIKPREGAVKTPKDVQQVAKVAPEELQKPQPAVPEKKTATAPTPPATSPKPAPATVSKPEAKPAPKPVAVPVVPVTKPEPKPAGKSAYSVQIGAFKSEANATALSKQYKDKGYDAFILKAQKDKETIYRVLIGKFGSKKEAEKQSESISAKEKTKAIIFKE